MYCYFFSNPHHWFTTYRFLRSSRVQDVTTVRTVTSGRVLGTVIFQIFQVLSRSESQRKLRQIEAEVSFGKPRPSKFSFWTREGRNCKEVFNQGVALVLPVNPRNNYNIAPVFSHQETDLYVKEEKTSEACLSSKQAESLLDWHPGPKWDSEVMIGRERVCVSCRRRHAGFTTLRVVAKFCPLLIVTLQATEHNWLDDSRFVDS